MEASERTPKFSLYMPDSYKGIFINTTKGTHKEVYNLIKHDTEKSVVDIPSGRGAFILRLKDNGFSNVTGVDIEDISQIEHDDFVLGDMTKRLPLESASKDIVVCIDGIEHIYGQASFVEEVNRSLKVGGSVIISTPNISSIRSRWRWFWTGHHYKCSSPLDERNPTPLHHVGMISFHELRYLLHTRGFEIEQISTNRIKLISWLYMVFVPWVYLSTIWIYKKTGPREGTVEVNRSMLSQVFNKNVLFGETLIVKAVKRRDLGG
ncbi:MAG: class I SAM-dependent methyltransferase [Roseivirga sp.]|nr:class I SAM-dependent methyltransferase [Roseivirga sp.]MBO6496405.1 class I SAM-dependent methyltransferase [Roseivirga sp.]MBO6761754.1 class I SAM-dependent methyltransferase [Roseivirga sp.]